MPDYSIAMQGQPVNIKSPAQAVQEAAQAKNAMLRNRAIGQEMQDREALNQAYRDAGGNINAMVDDPRLGFDASMQIKGMQAEQTRAQAQADKEQAAADKLRLQSGIEKLNYGSQLLSGATPENWSQIRAEFGQMTGQDLGEQFDPAKVQSLMQQGLSMKDKLSNEWKQKGYELNVAQFGEQQRHNRTSEGISYMNAQNRGESSGKPQNLVWDASRGVFVDPNTRTFIAPTGQDGSSALPQKPESSAEKTARLKQENETRIADKDFANSLDAATAAKDLLPKATGSGFGAMRDKGAALFGKTTEGAQNAAKLKVIAGKLVAAVPKFSGPQSDKDVQLYREMAGQVGDDTLPYETRQAALETVIALQSAEADRRKLISGSNQSQAPSASFDPSAFHR